MKKSLLKERDKLLGLSHEFWKPRVVQIAVRRRVFDLIEKWKSVEPVTARALGVRLGWEPRAAEIFLNSLAACGLLVKKKSEYRNAPAAKEFLVTGKKFYAGHAFELAEGGWESWGRLEESLRSGKPFCPPGFAQDADRVRSFTLAMQSYAVSQAKALAKRVPLRKCRALIDLGSGSGAFSIAFLKANKKLQATLYDQPAVLEVSREFVEAAGMEKRVYYQPGNFVQDPVPGVYDAALMSHILHMFPEDACKALIKKAHDLLSDGGLLILQDFFLEESRIEPLSGALFSLNMLLHTTGRSYSAGEVTAWLKAAGFREITHKDPKEPSGISAIIAEKK